MGSVAYRWSRGNADQHGTTVNSLSIGYLRDRYRFIGVLRSADNQSQTRLVNP
jgi:hypothetical protein